MTEVLGAHDVAIEDDAWMVLVLQIIDTAASVAAALFLCSSAILVDWELSQ